MRCGTLQFGCSSVRCGSVDRVVGVYTQGTIIINPRRACAERVTVVVSCVCVCVCLSVCLYVCLSEHAILAVRAVRSITKDLKLSYSKVRAFFTHLGRGGHL